MDAKVLVLWLGLSLGNFTYQAFNQRNWGRAAERSYYQGFALLVAWGYYTIINR